MSRGWKPGDVAMADGCRMMRTQSGWLYASPGSLVNYTHAEGSSADHVTALARPLVVIDPEDAEQVERLRDALPDEWCLTEDAGIRAETFAAVQAALREFADPKPRIEEPTGLGAVVRDANGDAWIRNNPYDDCKWRSPDGTWVAWADIDAVEILAAGWSE